MFGPEDFPQKPPGVSPGRSCKSSGMGLFRTHDASARIPGPDVEACWGLSRFSFDENRTVPIPFGTAFFTASRSAPVCPDGAEHNSPGQSAAPPWVRRRGRPSPEGAQHAYLFRPFRASRFPISGAQGGASLCPGLIYRAPSGQNFRKRCTELSLSAEWRCFDGA